MFFEEYKELMDRQKNNKDVREIVFQENVIRPFLQSIFPDYDVEPTDTKTGTEFHDYSQVMNPDKTKVLICYGGLRVDGCSLVVQTAISRWESLYYFETPEVAVEALKKITETIEQKVPLIEL